MTRRQAATVVVVALAMLLAACGGGGGGDTSALSADDDLAQRATLVLTDFPEGMSWKRETAPPDTTREADDRRLADCVGRPPPATLRTTIVDSESFTTADGGGRARSTVQVMKTEAIAKDDFVTLRTDRELACWRQQLDTQLERDNRRPPPAGSTSISRLDFGTLGDESAGLRYVSDGQVNPAGGRLVVDLLFVRQGRAELAVGFVGVGGNPSTDVERAVLTRMVARAG